ICFGFRNSDFGFGRTTRHLLIARSLIHLLERTLAQALHEQDILVAVVNPRQIRDFARASNQLAKTDQINARMIARFAELIQPRRTPPLSVSQQKLRDLTARKRQVSKLFVQDKTGWRQPWTRRSAR
ncbi:MAG: transposase, partial [Planctomycetaceae bacterium]|nr:transposase [Planctomycetaceae bacterium]